MRTTPPSPPPLVFGIYPGGASITDPVAPDQPDRVHAALASLQGGPGRPFRVRCYTEYRDSPDDLTGVHHTPRDPDRYLGDGRRLDLVAQFQARGGNVAGYAAFVRRLVARYGPVLDTLQITEEANVTGGYGMDGDFPDVRAALVAGVLAAKDEARRRGHHRLRVGFNVVTADEDDGFFADLGRRGGPEWVAAVDYVGLDCFPDVWDHPVAPDGQPGDLGDLGDLGDAMVESLRWLREKEMPAAGLPATTPIVVAEHGWPTGAGRSPRRQADVLERAIRAVDRCRGELNVTGYTLFALRDSDSAGEDLFDQFGIVIDDYTPKPAFATYRRLVTELGQPRPTS